MTALCEAFRLNSIACSRLLVCLLTSLASKSLSPEPLEQDPPPVSPSDAAVD